MAEEANSPEVTETQATETTETTETTVDTTDTGSNPEEVIKDAYKADEESEGEEVVEPDTLYAGKFKSVSDLEKSYKELQSTFSKKLGAFEGAPEEYALPEELAAKLDEGKADKEVLGVLQEWGKENQLSNEGLVDLYNGYEQLMEQKRTASYEREMKALGPEAQARLDNVYSFLETTLGDKAEAISSFLGSAASIEAVELLMKKVGGGSAAPANVPTASVSKEKVQEMRFATNENGDRLMSVDPSYRAKVLKLEAQLLGK